jgi:hypothetical protein
MYAVYETNKQRAADQASRVEGRDTHDLIEDGFETYDDAVACADEKRGRIVVKESDIHTQLYRSE